MNQYDLIGITVSTKAISMIAFIFAVCYVSKIGIAAYLTLNQTKNPFKDNEATKKSQE